MSSTTTTVSMNARSRSGKRGPTSASSPSAKAVSVDIAIAPAVRRGAAGVEGEVDRDRHGHAAEPGEQRQGEPPPLAQLAEVELPARLEADDEEEERHQPAVHPVAEIERHARVADADRELVVPDRVVGRRVDVHPDERGDRRGRAGPPRRPSPCAGTPAAASEGSVPRPCRPEKRAGSDAVVTPQI